MGTVTASSAQRIWLPEDKYGEQKVERKMESPWRRGSWSLVPRDIKELWEMIGRVSFALSDTRTVWRGMSNESFEVKSSLVRRLEKERVPVTEAEVREREALYLKEARAWGLGISEFGAASDLHLLAMLQHHGAPTRLIDVTYNPLTALWFACQENEQMEVSGVLVAFMVTNTKRFVTTDHPSPTFEDMDNLQGASLNAALSRSAKSGSPVMVVPQKPDARMTAQEGLFITSAVPSSRPEGPAVGLPEANPNLFSRMHIPAKIVDKHLGGFRPSSHSEAYSMIGIIITPRMKRDLLAVLEKNFNRSARTMYPDISGFVGSLRMP